MTGYKPRLGLSVIVEVLTAVHSNVHLGFRLTRVNHLAQELNQLILLFQRFNYCHLFALLWRLCRSRLLIRDWLRLQYGLLTLLWIQNFWCMNHLLVVAGVVR